MKKNKLCLHLFIKNKLWGGLVFGVKEDRSLQAKLWDEYDDCVLPHKQNESFFVQDASALEEQLEQDHLYLKSDSCSTITQAKRFMGFQIDMMPILTNSVKIITVQDSEVFFFYSQNKFTEIKPVCLYEFTCVWKATDALWAYWDILCL